MKPWFLAVVVAWPLVTTDAAQIYVDAANDSGVEDGTPENPFSTIQPAIDIAGGGDQVRVAAGHYHETIVMKNGVDVLGAGARNTIIDGTGLENAVVLFDQTRLTPVISGFTLTGGKGDRLGTFGEHPIFGGGGVLLLNAEAIVERNVIRGNVLDQGIVRGAGIYVGAQAVVPEIRNNVFRDNITISSTLPDTGEGGGIYIATKSGGVVLEGNLFEGNQAIAGGAVYLENTASSTVLMERNWFLGNSADSAGGVAITDVDGLSTLVQNNILAGNLAHDAGEAGGGISVRSFGASVPMIVNNTFVGNGAPAGSGGALVLDDLGATTANAVVANNVFAENTALTGGGIDHTAFGGTIRSNDFHDNTGGDLYDAGGSGAVLVDNLFLDPEFTGDAPGDYRLQPTSPAVDVAYDGVAPTDDVDGFARPFDGPDGDSIPQSDIGAHEYPGGEILGLRLGPGWSLDWPIQPLQDAFHVYRGSLARLRQTGEYTQDPLLEPLAARFCAVPVGSVPFDDGFVPAAGDAVLYLVALTRADYESTLGRDADGLPRMNSHPCP